MTVQDVLNDKVAQELLESNELARLAYTGTDGTPRVVPIWFHWTGTSVVLATPSSAPKIKALRARPEVALTIDTNGFPHHVLLLRGTAQLEHVDGVVPEYAAAAQRYFGREQGQKWVDQLRGMGATMERIAITPTSATVLDFETRYPSAIAKLFAGAGPGTEEA